MSLAKQLIAYCVLIPPLAPVKVIEEEEEKDELESEDEIRVPEEEDDPDTSSDEEARILNPARLTQRQAAMAGGLEVSHVKLGAFLFSQRFLETYVSADDTLGRKKKVLTEMEMALKREETARKRKNLSEKKLEDEKVLSDSFSAWNRSI